MVVLASMPPAYGGWRRPPWHLADGEVVGVALAVCFGVWSCRPTLGAMLVAPVLVAGHRKRWLLVCASMVAIGGWCGARAWSEATPRTLGPYRGWVSVVGDPSPIGAAARATVNIDGERFDIWAYGGKKRRVMQRQSGELMFVECTRQADWGASARRARVRHVVGRCVPTLIGDVLPGTRLDQLDAEVRLRLRHAAERSMVPSEAALFTGLVIGDDVRQPTAMVAAFRSSGLSHLTAVSGQNVAFVLAMLSPLLRRLRPWWRWSATIGVVLWFMALTRFEPSVLRAGLMAMLAASAFVSGRDRPPIRLLAIAVTALVLVDPLLVWSVGFWLSVGATAGVAVLGPALVNRLPGPVWIVAPLSVTLGAQIGVAAPSLLAFGRLPLVSVPANLLAVPVAGVVMMIGVPAGLVASAMPRGVGQVIMWPMAALTRWVSVVARLAARLEPAPLWSAASWMIVALGLALSLWWHHRRGARVSV